MKMTSLFIPSACLMLGAAVGFVSVVPTAEAAYGQSAILHNVGSITLYNLQVGASQYSSGAPTTSGAYPGTLAGGATVTTTGFYSPPYCAYVVADGTTASGGGTEVSCYVLVNTANGYQYNIYIGTVAASYTCISTIHNDNAAGLQTAIMVNGSAVGTGYLPSGHTLNFTNTTTVPQVQQVYVTMPDGTTFTDGSWTVCTTNASGGSGGGDAGPGSPGGVATNSAATGGVPYGGGTNGIVWPVDGTNCCDCIKTGFAALYAALVDLSKELHADLPGGSFTNGLTSAQFVVDMQTLGMTNGLTAAQLNAALAAMNLQTNGLTALQLSNALVGLGIQTNALTFMQFTNGLEAGLKGAGLTNLYGSLVSAFTDMGLTNLTGSMEKALSDMGTTNTMGAVTNGLGVMGVTNTFASMTNALGRMGVTNVLTASQLTNILAQTNYAGEIGATISQWFADHNGAISSATGAVGSSQSVIDGMNSSYLGALTEAEDGGSDDDLLRIDVSPTSQLVVRLETDQMSIVGAVTRALMGWLAISLFYAKCVMWTMESMERGATSPQAVTAGQSFFGNNLNGASASAFGLIIVAGLAALPSIFAGVIDTVFSAMSAGGVTTPAGARPSLSGLLGAKSYHILRMYFPVGVWITVALNYPVARVAIGYVFLVYSSFVRLMSGI